MQTELSKLFKILKKGNFSVKKRVPKNCINYMNNLNIEMSNEHKRVSCLHFVKLPNHTRVIPCQITQKNGHAKPLPPRFYPTVVNLKF